MFQNSKNWMEPIRIPPPPPPPMSPRLWWKKILGLVRIRHSMWKIATQPVILWIELYGKPKWLPFSFGCYGVMHTAPTDRYSKVYIRTKKSIVFRKIALVRIIYNPNLSFSPIAKELIAAVFFCLTQLSVLLSLSEKRERIIFF